MNDDFYIGYLPKMTPQTAKTIKRFVAVAIVAAVLLAAAVWFAQKSFPRSVFEFGTVREFAGTIEARPIPFLIVEREASGAGLPLFDRIPLVGEGKHGFVAELYDGKSVKLNGTLIYRDELEMIEVAGGTVEAVTSAVADSNDAPDALGVFTLRGEIVDSKCYLGVMNPGQSKPHRDCAVACLRGGVPALFIARDATGMTSELWLVSTTGASVNESILDYVAEPVELSGEVTRRGDQLFLAVDPARITRLP